jgi:hypothetical protein
MRKFLYGMMLVAAAEGAALACSCIAPGTPEQSRGLARDAVRNAIAIVEVEVVSGYRPGSIGEEVRVRRLLWGRAPNSFGIERRAIPSSAACDLLLTTGQRKVLILYPAATGRHRRFVIQNSCSDFLVNTRGHLAVTLQEARRR